MNLKEITSKLQGLTEKQKKIILFSILGILAVVMGYFWMLSAKKTFLEFTQSFNPLDFNSPDSSKIEIPSFEEFEEKALENSNPENNEEITE